VNGGFDDLARTGVQGGAAVNERLTSTDNRIERAQWRICSAA
jgi:hypothetical protein